MVCNKFQTQYPETYTVGVHALWTKSRLNIFWVFQADRSGLSAQRPTPKTKNLVGHDNADRFQSSSRTPVSRCDCSGDRPARELQRRRQDLAGVEDADAVLFS
jgi:hypothetical protein